MKPPMTYNPDTRAACFLADPDEEDFDGFDEEENMDGEPGFYDADDVDELTEWFDYDPDC